MPKQKKSFFQRLTGAVDIDDGYDDEAVVDLLLI
ncbi:MAG: hypothetical protein UU89_C0046G0006 [Parcubacteria group bacterium GW2011_GWC2_42_11]|nr:MAG: hypothetical protein UU89_C0046G0006 [Parcubacteria group bacterium GW2011_GWC2_42_11]